MNQSDLVQTQCQNCDNPQLTDLLFLGFVPPVNSMVPVGSKQSEFNSYSLSLCHCESCLLTQIVSAPEMRTVFPYDYPYRSKMTESLVANFREQANIAHSLLRLKKDSLVVDIGSNDGSLLSQYAEFSRVVGVEPTVAAEDALSKGILTLNKFFDEQTCDSIIREHGNADLVTACNVFAHIPDLNNLIKNIGRLLGDDGVFISESHYLDSLIETLQFDTIYHEHLRYYSIEFLKTFLESHQLTVFRIDKIPTHGGSIRIWASKDSKITIDASVDNFLDQEKNKGNCTLDGLKDFSEKTISWRHSFLELLMGIRNSEKTVAGLGAPSRASTLTSYCGITVDDVFAIGELTNSEKIGRYMPGTIIPVVDEKLLLLNAPDYLLIFSWHIAAPIMKNIVSQGFKGSFIIPLPVPKVINWSEI